MYCCKPTKNAGVSALNFKTHIFTGPGTFTVCSVGSPPVNTIDYLVVAGGGGGGGPDYGNPGGGTGGGGGGGVGFSGFVTLEALFLIGFFLKNDFITRKVNYWQ